MTGSDTLVRAALKVKRLSCDRLVSLVPGLQYCNSIDLSERSLVPGLQYCNSIDLPEWSLVPGLQYCNSIFVLSKVSATKNILEVLLPGIGAVMYITPDFVSKMPEMYWRLMRYE